MGLDEAKVFSQHERNYAQKHHHQVDKSIASRLRRDHHMAMQRSVLFAVLTISLVLVAPAQGQARGGGGSRAGGASHVGGGPQSGGRGFSNGSRGRRRWGLTGGYGSFWGAGYYPDWGWGGWDWGWDLGPSDDDYAQPPEQPSSPPVIVMQSPDNYRQAAVPPQSPKLIELPDSKNGEAAQNLGPTVFVFANGDKLESSRYVLTPDSLRVEIGRRQRTIPLADLNLDATIAANRQRGIDLRVPTDSSQIFLGF